MSWAELYNAKARGPGMVAVAKSDSADGAEVHQFEQESTELDNVKFPGADIDNISRGLGGRHPL